jgi:excinuclease ABC subunit A
MTICEAVPFFEMIPKIYEKSKTIQDVVWATLHLANRVHTSGGEAQRIKWLENCKRYWKYLARLDEPTTGSGFW